MASPRKGQSDTTTPPASTPGESSAFGSHDHSFTLQSVLQMQNTLGKLEQAVGALLESEEKTRTKLSRIEKILYAAGVVLLIFLGVTGWMLNTAKDFAMEYFKQTMHAAVPNQSASVAPKVPPKTGQQQ